MSGVFTGYSDVSMWMHCLAVRAEQDDVRLLPFPHRRPRQSSAEAEDSLHHIM